MTCKGEAPAIIGIDLRTTNSCFGVWQHICVEIIASDQGNRTTPSYAAFTDSEHLIGDGAMNQFTMNPINAGSIENRLQLDLVILAPVLAKPVLIFAVRQCKVLDFSRDPCDVVYHFEYL
ncbi:unnamed protein product [Miscanthus lutarioriparius]|uniref:Uncharacterized protein n=1 Tax=Miscanthus lutarioriparius TaxID=422564 RepID=A0A811QI84_9POAL|nr:unnamed protein product [Miscanthus lutarioriparius]